MSKLIQQIGIADYQVDDIEEHRGFNIVHVRRNDQSQRPACPSCRLKGSRGERSETGNLEVYSKGPYIRTVRHTEAFGRPTQLRIHTHRYQCRKCGKSFIPPLPGIKQYRQSSERYRLSIYELHYARIAGSVLARREAIGSASVERFYHEYTERKAGERFDGVCPPVFGTDETRSIVSEHVIDVAPASQPRSAISELTASSISSKVAPLKTLRLTSLLSKAKRTPVSSAWI